MKIGCCIPKSQIEGFRIKDEFDFIEAKYSDIKTDKGSYQEFNLFALNNIFSRDINIFNQPIAETKITIDRLFEVAKNYGIQLITFGSGGARKFLSSHDLSKNILTWVEILNYFDNKAIEHDIDVGIEPLSKLETNFINTIAEAAFYIDQLELQRIGITADTFHFFDSDGSLINLKEHFGKIKHVHIASDKRKYPKSISSQNRTFLEVLKSLRYSKTIAIEIDWREELENDREIVYLLQQFFNE